MIGLTGTMNAQSDGQYSEVCLGLMNKKKSEWRKSGMSEQDIGVSANIY